MRITYKEILSLVLLVAVIGAYALFQTKPWQAGASVAVGSQYQSTTTPAVAARTNLCPARVGMASSTTGVLGTINVMGAGTGELLVLDATTTDNTLRVPAATSSLVLAQYATGVGTTSQVFDVEFERGLLIDYTTGVASTSISYRCEG